MLAAVDHLNACGDLGAAADPGRRELVVLLAVGGGDFGDLAAAVHGLEVGPGPLVKVDFDGRRVLGLEGPGRVTALGAADLLEVRFVVELQRVFGGEADGSPPGGHCHGGVGRCGGADLGEPHAGERGYDDFVVVGGLACHEGLLPGVR
ncbi:hypothetical protein AB0E67_08330 [Streptomyces sp. NPDC032161]|uniref:hypothetical protein n=1 Tax=unclassified Streptomyces TaxID=2593676 RepID=UPI0033C545E4